MADNSVTTPKAAKGDGKHLKAADFIVSRSTGRRYNDVVQEFAKNKLGKSESSDSSIPPSQVLTLHSDQAGPEEGSYVCWESPDTPQSQRPIKMMSREDSEGTGSTQSSGKSKSRSTSKFTFSGSGMDSFRTADPFSPDAENVVRLSDSSMQFPWNDSFPFNSSDGGTSKSSGTRKGSDATPVSNTSKPGSDVITVFPKGSNFPSPDRNTHGPPLTTFSKVDGLKNDSYTSIPFQDPVSLKGQDVSKEKLASNVPRTPSIRLTSVKGSSHSLFEGSFSKDSGNQQRERLAKNPPINKDSLLSPSLVGLTERTKSRHPMGKDEGDHNSTDSLELTESTVESKESKKLSSSDNFLDDSRSHKTPDDERSFYSPPDSPLQPNTLDFDNLSGMTTDSRKKYRTPLSADWAYPPEEADVNSYTINISTPPRSVTSSRSSLHPKETSSWHETEDSDFNRKQIARDKSLLCQERFGYFLIICGTLMLMSSVIAILAIEIPAHQGEALKISAEAQGLGSYLNFSDFQDFFLGNFSSISPSTNVYPKDTLQPVRESTSPDNGEKDQITDGTLFVSQASATYAKSPHPDMLIGVTTESSTTAYSVITTELPSITIDVTEVPPDNLRTKIPAHESHQNYSTLTSDANSEENSKTFNLSTIEFKENVRSTAKNVEYVTSNQPAIHITRDPLINSINQTVVPAAALSVSRIHTSDRPTGFPTGTPLGFETSNNLLPLTEVDKFTHNSPSSFKSTGLNTVVPADNLTALTSISSESTVSNALIDLKTLVVNPRKIEIIPVTSAGSPIAEESTSQFSAGSSIAEDFSSHSNVTNQFSTLSNSSESPISDVSQNNIRNVTLETTRIIENFPSSSSNKLNELVTANIDSNNTTTPATPRTSVPISVNILTKNIQTNGTTGIFSVSNSQENATRSSLTSVGTLSVPVKEKNITSPAVNETNLPSIEFSVSSTEKSTDRDLIKDVPALSSNSAASTLDQSTIKLPMPLKDMNPQNILGVVKNISVNANFLQTPVTKASPPAAYVDKDFLPTRPSWLDSYYKYRKSSS